MKYYTATIITKNSYPLYKVQVKVHIKEDESIIDKIERFSKALIEEDEIVAITIYSSDNEFSRVVEQ